MSAPPRSSSLYASYRANSRPLASSSARFSAAFRFTFLPGDWRVPRVLAVIARTFKSSMAMTGCRLARSAIQ